MARNFQINFEHKQKKKKKKSEFFVILKNIFLKFFNVQDPKTITMILDQITTTLGDCSRDDQCLNFMTSVSDRHLG